MKYQYERKNGFADGKVVDSEGVTVARIPCVAWNKTKYGNEADTADVDQKGTFITEALNVLLDTGRTPKQLADERAELLTVCLRFAAQHVCQCDCSVDKETGESPPETNIKNSFGEPVWANEVCDYCIARAAITKVTGGVP